MFNWLFLKFADGYNTSFLGAFVRNAQAGLGRAWNKSALGGWIKEEKNTN